MAGAWSEVSRAGEENRRELVLSGPEIEQRITKHGLDKSIYGLTQLNFLEISRAGLTELPDDVGKLSALTSLVLHSNKLDSLPVALGKLDKVHLLDVSYNQLKSLPSLAELASLHSLLLSHNELSTCPDLTALSQLRLLDLSHNQLTAVPSCPETLTEARLGSNKIQSLDGVGSMKGVKVLSLEDNKLTEISAELLECSKIKDLKLSKNPVKERKMLRLCDTEANAKQVMDHLSKISGSKNKKGKGKARKDSDHENNSLPDGRPTVTVLRYDEDSSVTVRASPAVLTVRPYVVCCVLKNLDLSGEGVFKKFITIQTKLHESVCDKRQAATIATHDLKNIKSPLDFQAKEPDNIMVQPLFRSGLINAKDLVQQLLKEAEEHRKEKKRSQISGIYKYLSLVRDQAKLSCLVDTDGTVISLPPITNSSSTKVSVDTKAVLLEVTSSASLDKCKQVMEELIKEALQLLIAGSASVEVALEQVKVTDLEGQLRVMYPSKTDLVSQEYIFKRDM